MNAKIIGAKIKSLRKSRGITQRAFARALHVTPQSVSKWERGLNSPGIDLLPCIARYFEISIDALFGFCG